MIKATLAHASALAGGVAIIILVTITAKCNQRCSWAFWDFLLTFYHIRRLESESWRRFGWWQFNSRPVLRLHRRRLQQRRCKCDRNCKTIIFCRELFFLKIPFAGMLRRLLEIQKWVFICWSSSLWQRSCDFRNCTFQWWVTTASRLQFNSAIPSLLRTVLVLECTWRSFQPVATSSKCAQLAGATFAIDSRHTKIPMSISSKHWFK